MGTDPTPPEPTPDTPPQEPNGPGVGGTEPAPVTPPEPPADEPEAPVTEDPSQAGVEDGDESDDEPAEGLGEPLDRKTTLADDAAPAGHLTDTPDGPRQHGDVNPELGQAPDTLAGTAQARGDQASEGLTEPDQIETDRPDVGTPVTDEPPAPLAADDESEED